MSLNSNIKVHFAIAPPDRDLPILKACGAEYMLFTAFPYIFPKKESYSYPNLVEARIPFKHAIMDSGLFTLMFGAMKGKEFDYAFLRSWMHRLVEFAKSTEFVSDISVVECDCQKLIGPEYAWELREEMRSLMPNRSIINVFHLEDGPDGFDRLVEFSDYIAISVPELRINRPKDYREMTATLARRARKMKPTIDIHLLGCTQKDMLLQNAKIATTSDSSSWSSAIRFGELNVSGRQYKVGQIKQEVRDHYWDEYLKARRNYGLKDPRESVAAKRHIATSFIQTKLCLRDYTRWCGPQD